MANHKSALKRIRSNRKKRIINRIQHKTVRNVITNLKKTTEKKQATQLLYKVVSMIDKLVKRNIIHKNKAGNLKSKVTKYVTKL